MGCSGSIDAFTLKLISTKTHVNWIDQLSSTLIFSLVLSQCQIKVVFNIDLHIVDKNPASIR